MEDGGGMQNIFSLTGLRHHIHSWIGQPGLCWIFFFFLLHPTLFIPELLSLFPRYNFSAAGKP